MAPVARFEDRQQVIVGHGNARLGTDHVIRAVDAVVRADQRVKNCVACAQPPYQRREILRRLFVQNELYAPLLKRLQQVNSAGL
jgi:hypothetical protein